MSSLSYISLTCSGSFSNYLQLSSIDTESVNSGDASIGDAYVKSTDTGGVSTEKNCIKDTYARDTNTGNITSTKVTYIKDASIDGIYSSAHKLSKSSIGYSRLLVELISKILVSSYLYS